MTHTLTTNYAKNYCNRTIIVKVIVENVVTSFFWDTVYKDWHQRYTGSLYIEATTSVNLMTCWYMMMTCDPDSLRAFKENMKLGRFKDVDPEEQKRKEAERQEKERQEEEKANSIQVGNR